MEPVHLTHERSDKYEMSYVGDESGLATEPEGEKTLVE